MHERNQVRATGAVAALAVVAVLATAGPAGAFYWRGWPGSKVAPPRVINPSDQGKPGNPPLPSPNPFPPPGGEDEVPPPVGPQPPPEPVPEPATGLAGLLGLAAVTAVRWWRRGR